MRLAYSQTQRVEAVRLFWKMRSATNVVLHCGVPVLSWCGCAWVVGSGWQWAACLAPLGENVGGLWVGFRSWKRAPIRGCVLGVAK